MTIEPEYFTVEQVAILVRRSPKTVLNMLYYHRFPRHIERIGRSRRRLITPDEVRQLRNLLPTVKTNPPALRQLP